MTDHHDLPRVKDWQCVVPEDANRYGEQATVRDVILTLDRPLTAVQTQALRAHFQRTNGVDASAEITSDTIRLYAVGLAHLHTQVAWVLNALARGKMADLIDRVSAEEERAREMFEREEQRIGEAVRQHRAQ